MDQGVGQLMQVAFNFVPSGALACNGSTASVEEWPELAELLGTTFGGDGTTTFGLPNLPSAGGLQWLIAGNGPSFGSGQFTVMAEVRPMVMTPPAGSTVASTWFPCDGRLLQIQQNIAMYALMGTTFGGDGRTTFAMPNLPPLADGISWWIAGTGQFPALECDPVTPAFGGNHSIDAYLATIVQFAYDANSIAKICGFALCRGQQIRVGQSPALFSLVYDTFGGDGLQTFNLPNLPNLPVAGAVTPAIVTNGTYPSRA
jgi:microcystin-dependent protein